MLSASCTYGLRALAFLAVGEPEAYVPVRKVADRLGISFHFLSKILHGLAAADLVETYRGPNGGARLARPASDISVYDVIIAIDGPGLFTACVLGLPGCGKSTPCPMHESWAMQRTTIESAFRAETLAGMAAGYREDDRRL